MHAQNWKQPFDEDVAKAKDRHQNAIAEAHEEFKKPRLKHGSNGMRTTGPLKMPGMP